MSFLTRTTTSALRSARITPAVTAVAPRFFSNTAAAQRGPVETAKDAVKTVDRAVSNKIVDGIEIGENVTQKVKDATGIHNTSELKGKASEVTGQAKGKASEVAGQAKGTASEVSGEAKGKASEVAGQAKEKTRQATQ
ncbi:hypothetical protein F5884DRAFT_760678 [Xylogone sp. PMI_703]|nr:hypothetical protein F5884DRAFT_760678 [Xylogone sp. PMI_703]